MDEPIAESFLHACGATGPVRLEVRAAGSTAVERLDLDRPSLLIGRHRRADVRLDHEAVSIRHAYLQVVDGRLFCLDLESRTGTQAEQGGGRPGWLGPSTTIRVGPYRIRAWLGDEGDDDRGELPPDLPSPLSSSYVSDRPLARASLEFRDGPLGPASYTLSRVVTLAGSSAACKLRSRDADASKFSAALVRTPAGVWLVDLLSRGGVRVNGRRVRLAPLAEGDLLRIGRHSMRVADDAPDGPRARRGRRGRGPVALPGLAGRPGDAPPSAAELVPAPTAEVLPLLQQFAQMQQQMYDQFQQVVLMMSQLFGSMHRDHMEAVRGEMEQIRRLTEEIQSLRRSSTPGQPAPPEVPPTPTPSLGLFPGLPGPDEEEPRPRLDPREIDSLVGERLAAFERERQSRWNKILRILTNP